MRPLVSIALGAIVVVAIGGRPARADARQAARAHVQHATELHKAGRFADALGELEAAYALDPQPTYLFAMGQLHVQLGHCEQAVAFYERYLAAHPAAATAQIASEAIDACRHAPTLATEAEATSAVAAAPRPHAAAPVVLPPAPVVATPAVPASPPRAWYRDPVGDALLGLGAAGGIAGGVLYGLARAERGRADGAPTYATYAAHVDRARALQTSAAIAGGAGAALVTAAAIEYVLYARRHRGGERALAIAPAVDGQVGLAIGGTF